MYTMIVTKNGVSSRILASGWTESECKRYREAYEKLGYTVEFIYANGWHV